MLSKIKDKIEIIGFYILKTLVMVVPLYFRYRFAEIAGILTYILVKKRREITLKNIRLAFPEKSEKEIKKIAINSFKNITKSFFEVLWGNRVKIEIEGKEIIENYVKNNQGVIIVSMHLGNWEMVGLCLGKLTGKFYPIAKRQRNREFDTILNNERKKYGVHTIIKGAPDAPKQIMKSMKDGGMLALICDQFGKDVEVNFFGRKTTSVSGPSTIYARFDAPVILVYNIRIKDNIEKVFIEESITMKKGNKKEFVQENMQIIYNRFEEIIRKYPEQWFWQHKRWRDL